MYMYKAILKAEIDLRGRQKKKHPRRKNNPRKRFCLEWMFLSSLF